MPDAMALDRQPHSRLDATQQEPQGTRSARVSCGSRNGLKVCSRCKVEQPTVNFHRRSLSRDGLAPACRACSKVVNAVYYRANKANYSAKAAAWYGANREAVKARTAAWYAANTAKAIAAQAAWQRRNPEKVAIHNKKWRIENPEAQRIAQRRLYQADPQRGIAKVQRRHALTRTAKAELVRLSEIIARDGPNCYICGRETSPTAPYSSDLKAHLEHVVPLASGGEHTKDNLRCACRRCNLLKSNFRTPHETARLLGLQPC